MGFVWELANVTQFGLPEVWDSPPRSPRHRKPRPRRGHALAALVHAALAATRAAPRQARLLLVTRPALADHRRAF
jgi:hypothetical protein